MAVIDVVKYDGGHDVLVWKHPNEELGTWTQLIVNESQEAVLFKGGRAHDIFGSGRHTLTTANIPLLNKLIQLPFGGRSPFTAEVWYVNKAYCLDAKWGTPSPIQLQDPKYGIFVPVRANGVFGIRVADAGKFLVKLVGTQSELSTGDIVNYFRGLYVTKVKDAVSECLVKRGISILEINAHLDELSGAMKACIAPEMEECGIELVTFYVNEISVPEEDPAFRKLKDALSRRAEMNIIGYSYQQERSFNTMESAAKNSGAGAQALGAGMGLGMGVSLGQGIGAGFAGMAGELRIGPAADGTRECPKCHAAVPAAQRFCGSCGASMESPVPPPAPSGENRDPAPARSMKFCPECGASLMPGMKFCSECGARLNVGEQYGEQ